MTQEERKLLLTDLCARFPYRVFVKWKTATNPAIVKNIGDEKLIIYREYSDFVHAWECCIEDIKPYLRPMSSMTEEEEEEYWNVINLKSPEIPVGEIPSIETIAQCSIIVLDWLLSKGFDIRGLIPMELALEAPEDMYK